MEDLCKRQWSNNRKPITCIAKENWVLYYYSFENKINMQ